MLISRTLLVTCLCAAASFAAQAAAPGGAGLSLSPVHATPQTLATTQTYRLYRLKDSGRLLKVHDFSALDANRDGVLSRSEVPRDLVALRAHYTEADWDSNLRLSPKELKMYFKGTAPARTIFGNGYITVYN